MNTNQRYSWHNNNRGHRGRGNSRGAFGRGNRGSWGQHNFRGHPRGRGGFWNGNFVPENPAQGNWNASGPWRKPKRDNPGKRLCESDIGVTEYMSDQEGFNGIIKSRYSDFHVSEISIEGEEAVLTNLKPPMPTVEIVDEDEKLLLTKYNVEILPMETWDNINKLAVCREETTEQVEVDVTGMTKEQRTKIHEAVKKAFGSCIVGSTVTADDKKYVRFAKYRKGVRIDSRVKWIWPGEYVYFVVYKENCDTMDAAALIAEKLSIKLRPSTVGFAGTKDRRAKTAQWMSVRRVQPARLARAATQLRSLHLGDYRFRHEPLRLGMLRGNRFQIALRNVTAAEEAVEAACRRLERGGFLNYYGLQRFGARLAAPTHHVGLKLLRAQFRQAIELILSSREGPLEECLRVFRSAGARAALGVLPSMRPTPEVRLLQALARDPRDMMHALSQVPRNTRLLYLHSYQSLIWNRAVSERIRRLGRTPAAGDIVLCDAAYGDTEVLDAEDSDDSETEDADGEGTDNKDNDSAPTTDKSENQAIDKTDDKTTEQPAPKKKKGNNDMPKEKIPVKVLTQEDIDDGAYTIFDIVMPLPGYNIEYPPNMKDYYEELLKNDGLELTLQHKHRSYSMSGAYRLVATRPSHTSWRFVRYSEPRADLVASQLDRLHGVQVDGIVPDGKYKALLLDITLPASCYATMALRELMKVDTSVENQAQQNNYHKGEGDSNSNVGETGDGTEAKGDNGNGTDIDKDTTEVGKGDAGNGIDNDGTGAVKGDTGTDIDNDAMTGVENEVQTVEGQTESEVEKVDKRKLEEEEHKGVKKAKTDDTDR